MFETAPALSPEQAETVREVERMTDEKPSSHNAYCEWELDEDGTILVSLRDDGAWTHARFGTDGKMIGDWF